MDRIIVFVFALTIRPICCNLDVATWMDDVDQFKPETCICVADSTPVCASDRRIYKNHCEFQCRNEYLSLDLDILHMDECLKASTEAPLPVHLNASDASKTSATSTTSVYIDATILPSTPQQLNISIKSSEIPSTTSLPEVSTILSLLPPIPLLNTSPSTIIPQFMNNINSNNVNNWKPEHCLCLPEDIPICASDGVTYKNVCEFKCRNEYLGWGLVISKFGRCEDNLITKTTSKILSSNDESYWKPEYCLCPALSYPICASDGRTYNNLCEFKCRNHYVGWNLTITKLKKCKCTSKTTKLNSKNSPSLDFESNFVDSWKSELCNCGSLDYPICATDGRTYRNLCEFKCRNQYLSWELLIVKFDKCESSHSFISDNEIDNYSSNYWKLLPNVWNSSTNKFY